ncbi:MAG: tetratricopeptide repeat protein [Elusimicrobia bacterium]|nr:tetratricopeptide repeat protein [Elusimicrobiota bacterium]
MRYSKRLAAAALAACAAVRAVNSSACGDGQIDVVIGGERTCIARESLEDPRIMGEVDWALPDDASSEPEPASAPAPRVSSALARRAVASLRDGDVGRARRDAGEAVQRNREDAVANSVLQLTQDRDLPTARRPAAEATAFVLPLGEIVRAAQFSSGADLRDAAARSDHAVALRPSHRAPLASATSAETPPALLRLEARNLLALASKFGREGRDLQQAIEIATHALERHPQYPDAYNRRSSFYAMQGRHELALADADASLKLLPEGNQPAHDMRAHALVKLGRPEEAAAAARAALRVNPQDAYAYLCLARAAELLGRFERMLREFKAAARLDPRFYPEYEAAARARGLAPEPLSELAADPAQAHAVGRGTVRDAFRRAPEALAWACAGAVAFLVLAALAGMAFGVRTREEDGVRPYLAAAGISALLLAAGALGFHRRWSQGTEQVSSWWRSPSSHKIVRHPPPRHGPSPLPEPAP